MLEGHLVLALGWTIFCVLHSVFADQDIKNRIAASYPRVHKSYRALYTVFAFISLGFIAVYQVRLPSLLLFQAGNAMQVIGWLLTVVGALIMLVCIKKYFLSLSGLKSLVANQVVANDLRIDGIHRFVRHPLYAGTFLFIWGTFVLFPLASIFIASSIITVYTLIGMRFEEQKLIVEFGDAYRQYMKRVPQLVPFTK